MQHDGVTSAILVALAYCDQFRYALTLNDVWQRLPQQVSKDLALWHEPVSPSQLEVKLHELVDKGIVFKAAHQEKSYYFLNKKSHPQYRAKLASAADQATAGVEEFSNILQKIPWIQAVALTGSLAMHQYKPQDDLDVCIVTKPGTLWLTRLIVGLISWVSGHRRGWEGEWQPITSAKIQRRWRWCTNLWLEQQPNFKGWSPSLYTAYELHQLKWLWDRGEVTRWLQSKNSWLTTWLPHSEQLAVSTRKKTSDVSSIVKAINLVAYVWQRLYMTSHITNERVGFTYAFFHPRATGQLVRQGWLSRLRLAIAHFHRQQRWQNWSFSSSVVTAVNQARRQGSSLTLVTGVFDGWHTEHQKFMEKARSLGGVLIVGVESDQRVRDMKGPHRPIFTQNQRAERIMLSGLADGVFVLPEAFTDVADYRALIHLLKPRYLAVSAHSAHQEVKQQLLHEVGGEVVVVHEHNPAVSTTKLLEQVRQ